MLRSIGEGAFAGDRKFGQCLVEGAEIGNQRNAAVAIGLEVGSDADEMQAGFPGGTIVGGGVINMEYGIVRKRLHQWAEFTGLLLFRSFLPIGMSAELHWKRSV